LGTRAEFNAPEAFRLMARVTDAPVPGERRATDALTRLAESRGDSGAPGGTPVAQDDVAHRGVRAWLADGSDLLGGATP
jgi:hypothetical protein